MAEGMLDRFSRPYIDALVRKKPRKEDPKDIRIRGVIEERFLSEPWARDAIGEIAAAQIAYLKDSIQNAGDAAHVHGKTQEILRFISEKLRSQIVEGAEYLTDVPTGTPVLLMTNHLGTYKLAGINPQEDLGADVPKYDGYDFMYPYPLYFGAAFPVAEALGRGLSYVSDDFPGVFGDVHRQAGFVNVPPEAAVEGSRTELLKAQTAEVGTLHPNTAIINFPEGGTSGKYNNGGPYDLLDFKTGGYVIAAELGIPVIHVAQFFHPKDGMRLKVFKPEYPKPTDREGYQTLARSAQAAMQEWLSKEEAAERAG